jgi:hypothetical protein
MIDLFIPFFPHIGNTYIHKYVGSRDHGVILVFIAGVVTTSSKLFLLVQRERIIPLDK